jgi:hypothetical protein
MVVPPSPDDSGDRGGSADGPNSESDSHNGGRLLGPHTSYGWQGSAVDLGGIVDSWWSSEIMGWPEAVFSPVIGHHD